MPRDKKLPALMWYPGDWRKDIAVQSLSFHDRGIWFEMLMLMHDSEQRGALVLNGQPMTDEMIARAIGLDKQTFNHCLTTLLSTGVAERDAETGAITNRRMLRDEHIRKVRAEAGKKGGNPALLKQTPTTHDKQKSTLSVSSSISSSSSDEGKRVKRSSPNPPSPGKDGDFALAQELLRECRLSLRTADVVTVAEQIAYEAPDRGGSQGAFEFIRNQAHAAIERGEIVNLFWFKDRKFAVVDVYSDFTMGEVQ